MTRVELAFGDGVLPVELPDGRTTVVPPAGLPAAPDGRRAVEAALARPVAGPPLRTLARRGGTVAIAVCDGTRPQPRRIVVPAILDALDGLVRPRRRRRPRRDRDTPREHGRGAPGDARRRRRRHRPGRKPRRARRAAPGVGRASSATTCPSGSTASGSRPTCGSRPASSSRTSSPASRAGRSSSRRGSPASRRRSRSTTRARIGHPQARWGVTEGNPVHDDVRAIAAATGPYFALDVVLDARPADRGGVRRRGAGDAPPCLRGRPATRRCIPWTAVRRRADE